MKTVTTLFAGFVLGVAASLAGAPVYGQTDPGARFTRAAPVAVLRVGPDRGRSYVPAEVVPGPRRVATFNVTFIAPFPPAAQRAFQQAVNTWALRLSSTVPIDVEAYFYNMGDPAILGTAGPRFFWKDFPNAPFRNTFYVDAVANKYNGQQLVNSPDIVAEFNSTFPNWHFGSRPAPAGDFDFTTIVLHELGHGLGFLGFGSVRAGLGSVKMQSPPRPSIYDRFTENSANVLLTSMPDLSPRIFNELQSKRLFYDSPRVRAANDNKPAKIYAPRTFVPGTSYVHLDESTFPAGNENSLMTPHLGPGETIRSPGPITKAIMRDVGW